MDDPKQKISKILIFLFLVLFPFGQILRFDLRSIDPGLILHPIDIVAGLAFISLFLRKIRLPSISKPIKAFLMFLTFSYIVSLTIFEFQQGLIGAFYLIRLIFYSSLFTITYDLAKGKNDLKTLIFDSLIAILIFVALFGWIQYFLYPDIRSFVVWGWDDHLFRLMGTFLDPGFTAILLVFGFLLTFEKYLRSNKKYFLILILFFFITLAFTYSRTGYFALIAGVSMYLILKKKIKWIRVVILALILMVLLLPRPIGEGVKLERLYSISYRFQNYKQTLQIWQRSSLFGVGYNNLCFARIKYLGEGDYLSHSCSGSDSSLLGLLATGGILSFISFTWLIKEIVKNIDHENFGNLFLSCLTSLFIHSLFVNSLFYPWVMGFMGILLAISIKR
jgi:O-antigen ligase